MKKLLLSLLVSLTSYSYAIVSISANVYAFVDNQSTNLTASVWQITSSYWDNDGWCDGANDSHSPLNIAPGTIRTFCGGNTNSFDAQGTEHEWWFTRNGKDWKRSYTEGWTTYASNYNPVGGVITIQENGKGIFFKEGMETKSTILKNFSFSKDMVVIYTVHQNGKVNLECYSYPQYKVNFFGGSNESRRTYLTWLRSNSNNSCSDKEFDAGI